MRFHPKFAGRPPVNPDWQSKSPEEKAAITWHGEQDAEDVRHYGKWMRDEAEKSIGRLYPKVEVTEEMAKDRPDLKEYVGKQMTVIAWLWTRTVASPNPACMSARVHFFAVSGSVHVRAMNHGLSQKYTMTKRPMNF